MPAGQLLRRQSVWRFGLIGSFHLLWDFTQLYAKLTKKIPYLLIYKQTTEFFPYKLWDNRYNQLEIQHNFVPVASLGRLSLSAAAYYSVLYYCFKPVVEKHQLGSFSFVQFKTERGRKSTVKIREKGVTASLKSTLHAPGRCVFLCPLILGFSPFANY